jgi:integrase
MTIYPKKLKQIDPKSRKPKVAYLVRVELPSDPLTGKRRKKSKQVPTYAEATELENRWKAEIARGTALEPRKTTVGELLELWLNTVAPQKVQPENLIGYEITVRKHVKPALGHVPVQKLTVEQVDTFYGAMQAAGYSSSQVRKCHLRLAAALRLARRWGWINESPTDFVQVPSVAQKPALVWTPDEVNSFLLTAASDGVWPYWLMAIETGARTSELLGLSWDDIDFDRGTARLGQRVVRLLKGTPIMRQGAKTAAGLRTVSLTGELVEELRKHKVVWDERRAHAIAWQIPERLVFCTASGRPLNPSHIRRSFDRLIRAAGVKRITPHGMRKTSITTLIAAGANPKAVAPRVGHADESITLKTYTAHVPQMDDEVMHVLNGLAHARFKDPGEQL